MKRQILIFVIILAVFNSCRKEPESPVGANKIELGISEIDTVTYWTAKTTSSVLDLANNEIVNYGHCWSNNHNPSIFENQTAFGILTDTIVYSSYLEDLDDDMKYYVRAYFTTALETIYSEEFSFTTIKDPCEGLKFINIEGKDYSVAPIGD